jgi:hypothetical protein
VRFFFLLWLMEHRHTLLLSLADVADNLRSGLSRNAIVCVGEIFKFSPRHYNVDNEAAWIVGLQSSTFILTVYRFPSWHEGTAMVENLLFVR